MNEKQFDQRYRVVPAYVNNPGARKRSRFVTEQQQRLHAELRRRPVNMEYFELLLDGEGLDAGAQRVGYFCNMIPVEIISALGARPVRLGCGNPALVQPGEEVFSGEICPVAKASFAAFLDESSLANTCDMLVLPTSCDAKKKLGEVLADFKPTFMLNLPPEQDFDRYAKSATSELKRMVRFLCERMGKKLSTRELRRQIDLGRQGYLFHRTAGAKDPHRLDVDHVRQGIVVEAEARVGQGAPVGENLHQEMPVNVAEARFLHLDPGPVQHHDGAGTGVIRGRSGDRDEGPHLAVGLRVPWFLGRRHECQDQNKPRSDTGGRFEVVPHGSSLISPGPCPG